MTDKRQNRTARMFPLNQPVAITDPIRAFKDSDNEEGTYHIQHGGQSFVGTARRGASLERLVAVGQRVPTLLTAGTTEPWIVTCISNDQLPIGEWQDYRQE